MVIKLPTKKPIEEEDKPIRFVPRKKRALNVETDPPAGPSQAPAQTQTPAPIDSLENKPPVELPPVLPIDSPLVEEPIAPPTTVKTKKWTEKDASEMTDRDWRAMKSDLQLKTSKPIHPLLNWSELPSKRQLHGLLNREFKTPTPIQRATVKLATEDNCDLIGIAPTGSGKTLAFTLPFLLKPVTQGLVLAPTRELAMQTVELISKISTDVQCVSLVGGHDIGDQQHQLSQLTSRKYILVATPGRLLDLIHRQAVKLDKVGYLVLDEADRMLDLGFEPQLRDISKLLVAKNRQTLLFSATWPPSVQAFSREFVDKDVVQVEIANSSAPQQIKQQVVLLDSPNAKLGALRTQLKSSKLTIVFVGSKAGVDHLVMQLTDSGTKAAGLHGGMSQDMREQALANFKSHKTSCLVATDVAARGVDVPAVSLVVNYDLPNSSETYVHRIGRTGRGDLRGKAVSLVTEADRPMFPELRKILAASRCDIPSFLSS